MSYRIHFCDTQLNVFSVQIAELLIRCAVEIESISKALYQIEGGNMNPLDELGNPRYLNYDFDCLKIFDLRWKFGSKQVFLVAPSMYFKNGENRVFAPFKNAHKGDTNWQKAYQAVKHNRVETLHKANIRVLIRAIAALYILNLFYGYTSIETDEINEFDATQGSDIFICLHGDMENIEELAKYVFIVIEDYEYGEKVEAWAEQCPPTMGLCEYKKICPSPNRYKITLNKGR